VSGVAGGKDDGTVVAAAIVWTVPTVIVLLFNYLFFEIMQGIVTFSLFVLPTAILWIQAILCMLKGRATGKWP